MFKGGQVMKEIIEKEIMAIVPKYIENKGNCTWIYTRDGIVELEKSIKTVIKNIAKYYHLDLRASNKCYKELLYTKKNLPIPFTPDKIFILVKMRRPIGQHDGAYGYLDINSIEKINYKEELDLYPRIILKNSEILEALCTLETLHKAIKNGEIVRELLKSKYKKGLGESATIYQDEDKPATKGDLALLYMEISRLHPKE